MSVVVTKKWSGKTKSRSTDNGDTAQIIFSVVGAIDEDDAMNNVASQATVYVGTLFDITSALSCKKVEAKSLAIGVHEVNCDFAIGNFQQTQDPLTMPWKYRWKTVTLEPKIDRDIDGNPILKSGLDPYTEATRKVTYISLEITLNEPFYNYALYKSYFNTVNSDTVSMVQPNGNRTTFPAGTIFCNTIEPAAAFTTQDKYVTITKNLEIWDPTFLNVDDPFQLRFLDTGSNGFFSKSGTPTSGIICKSDGTPVTSDVQLNGQGLPVDTTLKIYQQPPTSPATAVSTGSSPAGATVEQPASGAYYLKYKRYSKVALLPILIEPPH